MATGFATHPGEAKVEIPAIYISVNHFSDIRSEESISLSTGVV